MFIAIPYIHTTKHFVATTTSLASYRLNNSKCLHPSHLLTLAHANPSNLGNLCLFKLLASLSSYRLSHKPSLATSAHSPIPRAQTSNPIPLDLTSARSSQRAS
ncbi:hypothetical protein HBI56_115220 [Parastagonospora nodorum]|uniref:Uncharacterized protein n=1 Tax=Phaeosphaeria nodorum (strain SN15 / ATCC MYA-4574 / FGSC 10173) TaxID=321614 RepID=A0A7U2I5Y5_PHANO|nr:hypothetical protein HBH56_196080 [Parastagonospora nodorum]QRD00588.1 hypothetical protein JI435_415350 [Parastagonospora nodorum SN15]KAH3924887.1 hypothetical protein HBH54_187410 [Parastagonospora nodorum]KAH3976631.1 hypothetical protein HBH52_118930 [Parastagonospora nodorum]KAH4000691.1 hypothetical protein HBI10_102460 [Parastagonospora nodorum]